MDVHLFGFRGCLILGMSGNEVYPAAVAISIAKMMNDDTNQSWERPSSKTNPYACLMTVQLMG